MLTCTVAVVAAVLVVCAAATLTVGAVYNRELAIAAFLSDRGLSATEAEKFAYCIEKALSEPGKIADPEALYTAAGITASLGADPFSGMYAAYLNAGKIGDPFRAVKYLSAAKTLSEVDFIREYFEKWETGNVLSADQTMIFLKQLDALPEKAAAGGSEALAKAAAVFNRMAAAADILAEVPFKDMIALLRYCVSLTEGVDFGQMYVFDYLMYPGFTDEYAAGLRAAYEFLQGIDEKTFSDIFLYMPDRSATFVKFAVELKKTDIAAAAELLARVYVVLAERAYPDTADLPTENEIVAFVTECSERDPDALSAADREAVSSFLKIFIPTER